MKRNSDSYAAMISRISILADDFEKIASMVNESSRLRKKHIQESLSMLDVIIEAGSRFVRELKDASRRDLLLRDRHATIFNSCRALLVNLERQSIIASRIKERSKEDSKRMSELKGHNKALKTSLNKACLLLESIIGQENTLCFFDAKITSLKSSNMKKNLNLKRDTHTMLSDTETAIENSAVNYRRGVEFVKKLKGIDAIARSSDKSKIDGIVKMAAAGGKSARIVNRHSVTQFKFSDHVFDAVKLLHAEASLIGNNAREKYKVFNNSLEAIAELAVVIAVEFNDYLAVKEIFAKTPPRGQAVPAEKLAEDSELVACIECACGEIRRLAGLNFDMSETIAMNSKIESRTLAVTEEEIGFCEKLKDAVEKMTMAAQFPVEGSSRNINNARDIEKILMKISDSSC